MKQLYGLLIILTIWYGGFITLGVLSGRIESKDEFMEEGLIVPSIMLSVFLFSIFIAFLGVVGVGLLTGDL